MKTTRWLLSSSVEPRLDKARAIAGFCGEIDEELGSSRYVEFFSLNSAVLRKQ